MSNKVVLIIMDGWGLAADPKVSAISQAKTPFFDNALQKWTHIKLQASGLEVGLPKGQMGNSEVGHMNLGAGRIVYQDLVRINREFEQNKFEKNSVFEELVKYCEAKSQPLHIVGLLSDGGVHSSLEHLKGIVKALSKTKVEDVFIHCFTDGRDTSPSGGKIFLDELQRTLTQYDTGKIASLIGRYYAMDRDKRWGRIKQAYDLLTKGIGNGYMSPMDAIEAAYASDKTDEFVEASVIMENGQPIATIQPENGLLFFNFRTDRGRQLTHVLTQ
ncbi:MAG: 2,3-bisphosphoglycerate-independent phosphoglycerate mutase, partial [Bacteroidota bacterium]